MYMAEIKMPPLDVDWSRELSLVRIHVERVIGALKQKYSILQNILPINFCADSTDNGLSIIDKVFHVCCALTNLNPSVVPQD